MGAETNFQNAPPARLKRQAQSAASLAASLLAEPPGPFAAYRQAMAGAALQDGWAALDAARQSGQPTVQGELWPQGGPVGGAKPLGKSRGCESARAALGAADAGPGTLSDAGPITYPDEALDEPSPEATPGARERMVARYRFADGLRPLQSKWPSRCLRYRTEPSVQLQRDDTGRLRVAGVHSCGSIWTCPICAPRIYATRAGEVQTMVERAGGRSYMLTLTIRHHAGVRWQCRALHRGLARAWRRFWTSGRASVRMRRELLHVKHYVRGLETTHGPHGWHPHFHVLLISDRVLGSDVEAMVSELWREAVRAELGTDCMPTLEHGCKLQPSNAVNYIAKLGLEVSAILSKVPRADGHRTTWQIGQAAAAGHEQSRLLWLEYVAAIRGQRQMTWSRGTKAKFSIPEVSDEQAATAAIVPTSVLDVPGKDWDVMVWAGMVATALARCSADGLGWWAVYLLRAQPIAQARRAAWLARREQRQKLESQAWYDAHAEELAAHDEAREREAIQLEELRTESDRWARQVAEWEAGEDLDDCPPVERPSVVVERYQPIPEEQPRPLRVVASPVRGGPRGTRYRIERVA